MRASRVVSLSALTLALTVSGIGAAAAQTVDSSSSTAMSGWSDHSDGGSVSSTTSEWATADGAGKTTTFNSTGCGCDHRPVWHSDDEWFVHHGLLTDVVLDLL